MEKVHHLVWLERLMLALLLVGACMKALWADGTYDSISLNYVCRASQNYLSFTQYLYATTIVMKAHVNRITIWCIRSKYLNVNQNTPGIKRSNQELNGLVEKDVILNRQPITSLQNINCYFGCSWSPDVDGIKRWPGRKALRWNNLIALYLKIF